MAPEQFDYENLEHPNAPNADKRLEETLKKPNGNDGKLLKELSKKIDDKFTEFDTRFQENLAYTENITSEIQSTARALEKSAQKYVAEAERFNKPHTSIRELSITSKISLCMGGILTFFAALTIGIYGQENFSFIDPSNGWNDYLNKVHLEDIQTCKAKARNS